MNRFKSRLMTEFSLRRCAALFSFFLSLTMFSACNNDGSDSDTPFIEPGIGDYAQMTWVEAY
ncbi:MAG: hypothetical protein JRD04_09020 [Deltaproteobacteria bacterium]|nr:hypothetical protein [Deltaproteobacteria bacterium]